jgi:hypothetical protein
MKLRKQVAVVYSWQQVSSNEGCASRRNAKALRNFVEVQNGSKNSQSSAVLKIDLFFLPFAAGTVWRCGGNFRCCLFRSHFLR